MVDAADHHSLELAKSELFALLDKPTMAGIPVLVPVSYTHLTLPTKRIV